MSLHHHTIHAHMPGFSTRCGEDAPCALGQIDGPITFTIERETNTVEHTHYSLHQELQAQRLSAEFHAGLLILW